MKLKQNSDLSRFQNTIKELSKDDSKKNEGIIHYMSDDMRMAIDFDKVKEEYLAQNCLSVHYAKSVDALLQDENEEIFFVEFKNGEFEPLEIRQKAIDSVMICGDIIDKTLSFFRNESRFLLVVSDDKMDNLNPQQKKALHLAWKSEHDIVFWGLKMLRGYCFNKVSAKSKTQFEKWLSSGKLI